MSSQSSTTTAASADASASAGHIQKLLATSAGRRGVVGAILALAVLLGVIAVDPTQGWTGALVAGIFGATISLGALVHAALNGVGMARWWHPMRRQVMALADGLVSPAALLLITLVIGTTTLYPWTDASYLEAHPIVAGKTAYLNIPFFLARAVLVIGLWFGLIAHLRRALRPLDKGVTKRRMRRLMGASARVLVVFGITISVASWDWLMSLEPTWFSTMFGVYLFAGAWHSALAVLIIIMLRTEPSEEGFPTKMRHDMGKLLFGMSVFWGYIWFCQFMLIWYANIPEETMYFENRLSNGWRALFFINLALNFVIPFIALLSARAKKSRTILMQVAAIVVLGHWLDSLLLVAPSTLGDLTQVPIAPIAATVLVGLTMVWIVKLRMEASQLGRRGDSSTG